MGQNLDALKVKKNY